MLDWLYILKQIIWIPTFGEVAFFILDIFFQGGNNVAYFTLIDQ